jgi:cobalt-zinc-cadmium efflux system outer membrane protein
MVIATDAARQGTEDDTTARIKLAFYDLLRREAEARATAEDLQLTQQIRDRIALRHKVGESPKFDLIRAETEMLNAQRTHHAAVLRVDMARANLRLAVGYPLQADWQIKGELPRKISLPPLNKLKEELLARNPTLARSEAERQAAERRVDHEKGQRLPKIAVIAARDVDPTIQKSMAGLSLTVPLWDFKSGQISQARAELSRANHQLTAQKLGLSESLEATYRLYQIASNQVDALENQVLAQASAAQRIAEAAYRYGERGILEWLDAQRTYRAARNELITARYDLATVSVEIDRLRSINNEAVLSNVPAETSTLPRLQ